MDANEILRQSDGLCASGDYRGAMDLLEVRYSEAAGLGDKASELTLGNELLGFYRSFGRFGEAGDLCSRLSELVDSMGLGSTLAGATTLLNIGTSLKVLGKFAEADRCYDSALAAYLCFMPVDDIRLAPLYNNRALLYRDMGDTGKAKESFLLADRIVRANGAKLESAITRTNLASLLVKTGEFDEAGRYIEDAVSFFESPDGAGDYHSLAAYAARAELLWRSGDPGSAVREYRELAALARRIGAPERDAAIFLKNAEWVENHILKARWT